MSTLNFNSIKLVKTGKFSSPNSLSFWRKWFAFILSFVIQTGKFFRNRKTMDFLYLAPQQFFFCLFFFFGFFGFALSDYPVSCTRVAYRNMNDGCLQCHKQFNTYTTEENVSLPLSAYKSMEMIKASWSTVLKLILHPVSVPWVQGL